METDIATTCVSEGEHGNWVIRWQSTKVTVLHADKVCHVILKSFQDLYSYLVYIANDRLLVLSIVIVFGDERFGVFLLP